MRQTLLQRCWIVLCTLAVLGSCGPTMHSSATGGIPNHLGYQTPAMIEAAWSG